MTDIGIMIEGQDGLNWARWKRLLRTAEDCGYQCVFRADHFTNPAGEDKDSLDLWISLAYAATHTKSIEFGPLVAPITFRHPSMNVRYAAAIDDLSGGRLVLGMGAGWQAATVPRRRYRWRPSMPENGTRSTSTWRLTRSAGR